VGKLAYKTKGFFQMEQRIFEFLAEEMVGYITFAMYADFGRIAACNNYILHGEGSDENIVRQTKVNKGYSWSAEESLELIEMKKWKC
jgi:erythromycin esterase-like protein